jgi:hypothetical protein
VLTLKLFNKLFFLKQHASIDIQKETLFS